MGSSIEEQYRYMKEMSWNMGDEKPQTLVYLNRNVIAPPKRYHSKELQHDEFIRAGRKCPNCLGGSIPESFVQHEARLQKDRLK